MVQLIQEDHQLTELRVEQTQVQVEVEHLEVDHQQPADRESLY